MRYAVIQCSNGNFKIVSEWSSLDKARVNYHATCSALWNASDVKTASVVIVDERLNILEGCVERDIIHDAQTS